MAKILINSLLWYMNDRLSCLTAETILKIVSDFYSPEEIVEAKTFFTITMKVLVD